MEIKRFFRLNICSWTQNNLLKSVRQKVQFKELLSCRCSANWWWLKSIIKDVTRLEKTQRKFCIFSWEIYEHPNITNWNQSIYSRRYLYTFLQFSIVGGPKYEMSIHSFFALKQPVNKGHKDCWVIAILSTCCTVCSIYLIFHWSAFASCISFRTWNKPKGNPPNSDAVVFRTKLNNIFKCILGVRYFGTETFERKHLFSLSDWFVPVFVSWMGKLRIEIVKWVFYGIIQGESSTCTYIVM